MLQEITRLPTCVAIAFLIQLTGLGSALNSSATPVINVRGQYVLTNYSFNRPIGRPLSVNFSATISENAAALFATNADDESVWESIIYDGTNTYLLTPSAGHFFEPKEAPQCGLVSPGRLYYMVNRSLLNTCFPWMVYCLKPEDLTSNTCSPAVAWRSEVTAYGWGWKNIKTLPDGRFLKSFAIVRNAMLDLDNESSFLRPTLEYPQTIDVLRAENQYLHYLKGIPNNWVGRSYSCTGWYSTNGFTIPSSCEFKHFTYSGGATFITDSTKIQADTITLLEDNETICMPALTKKSYIRDYRYTRRDDVRMFPYAEYVGSGTWKSSNDPELLAQADAYMKNGPKIGQLATISRLVSPMGNRRLNLIWLSLLLVNVIAVAMLVRNKLKINPNPK